MSDSKKPAAKLNLHPLAAAIWRNENNGATFYSVTFERRYKDEAGNWQSSGSFNSGDLLLLAKLADQAHSKIVELRAKDRNAQPEDQAA
jgi:hypothetical protein